jgi:hypothetical protein
MRLQVLPYRKPLTTTPIPARGERRNVFVICGRLLLTLAVPDTFAKVTGMRQRLIIIADITNTSKEEGENLPIRGWPSPMEASNTILYKLSILPLFVLTEVTLSQLSTTTSMTARQTPTMTRRKNQTAGETTRTCRKPAMEAMEANAAKERTYPTDRMNRPDRNVPRISPI